MSSPEIKLSSPPNYTFRELVSLPSFSSETPSPDELRHIQSYVAEWTDDYDMLSDGINGSRLLAYSTYSKSRVERKLYPLAAKLGVQFKHLINEEELDRSLEFIDFAFSVYEGGLKLNVDNLGFSEAGNPRIVLPSESRDSISPGLDSPLVKVLPVLKYVPLRLRSQFALGIPPSVVDIYSNVSSGHTLGVLCPIFEDMLNDLSEDEVLIIADKITSDTLDFCKTRLNSADIDT